ncbi:MAG: alpha/beta family hydrolase [Planctomycetota bacterium]
MKTTNFSFVAHESKGDVSACLAKPRGAKAILVLGHGAGAGMHHGNMERIAGELYDRKIGSLRYQFPFMERGGGRDSQPVSLSTVVNAIRQAKKMSRNKPILAGGHSFGGRMTSLAAAESTFPSFVKGLIFFGFPLHAPNKPSSDRAAHLHSILQPMLFLTGTRDALNSLDLFRPIVKKLGAGASKKPPRNGPVKLHLLDTANHSYKTLKKTRASDEDVFVEMARVVDEWISDSLSLN